MIAFKIIYLMTSLSMSFAVARALIENWPNYAKSQRFYMGGFIVVLSGLTQRATSQLFNGQPFVLASGLVLLGLLIMCFGMRYGRDPRLQDQALCPEQYKRYLDLLEESRRERES